MTELEKNKIVLGELYGDKEFRDDVVENRLLDWDKAYTAIYYNKQSYAMEARGEKVYTNIRSKCQEYIDWFKGEIERMEAKG